MPAIITHDYFAQESYRKFFSFIGDSHEEFEAFLLGNQGPDPLFYSVVVPVLHRFCSLGKKMHDQKPEELLFALKRSYLILDDHSSRIGRAYALGFLCHYLLDSNMHPFVYAQEYELCETDLEGLDQSDAKLIHALIESEFDEMVLFTQHNKTVAHFDPSKEILKASDEVLDVISKMYTYVTMVVYGICIPRAMFSLSTKTMRLGMSVFHSKTGIKRSLIGRVEEIFKPYSAYKSISLRDIELEESVFENRAHIPWNNPFTDTTCTASFWDIYQQTQSKVEEAFLVFDDESFSLQKAQHITHNLNFAGAPSTSLLVVEKPLA